MARPSRAGDAVTVPAFSGCGEAARVPRTAAVAAPETDGGTGRGGTRPGSRHETRRQQTGCQPWRTDDEPSRRAFLLCRQHTTPARSVSSRFPTHPPRAFVRLPDRPSARPDAVPAIRVNQPGPRDPACPAGNPGFRFRLGTPKARSWPACCPRPARTRTSQGMRTVLPVVWRASRARWASAASLSAKVWLTRICTAPLATTSNSSAAMASRSARFAV